MRRIALAVALTLAFAGTILGQNAPPPAKTDARSEMLRKLSRRERKARINKLEMRFQDFLADVEPIAPPTEIDAFLTLETDAQRDSFVDDFWRRRDAQRGIPNQSFREVYYSRLEVARQQFKQINSDRARMYLIHGPPAHVVRTECQRLLQPAEIWTYSHIKGVGTNVRLLFYRPRGQSEYRLWSPLGGAMAINDLVVQEVAPLASADAGSRRAAESASPYSYITRIQLECMSGDEILRAITQMVQSRVDLLKLFEPARGEDEDASRLLRSAVIANPDAPKLTADFSVRYPAKEGSRTDVQMTLLVPRAELSPSEVNGTEVYTIDVTGEVLKEGKLWEKYRYRFDFPSDVKGEQLPIVIDRLLRPNSYTSRIRVMDANGGAEAIIERELEVPEIFVAEPVATTGGAAAAQPALSGVEGAADAIQKSAAEAAAAPSAALTGAPAVAVAPSVRLIPPPEGIVSGIETFETIVEGDQIKGVEFWLDGKKIAVRRSPPFALDLDVGEVPQMRRIRAVGIDAAGKPVAGDDIRINSGTEPFRVRITSPRIAPQLSGQTRVEMDVSVPEDEELASLELFWNERRMATMYDPPFVQTIDIPATDGVGYLRAVARLKDADVPPIEDVVMINTPAYMEELDVHLVELPTTVLIGGKPSSHLTEKDFKVLEDGKPVTISKFEYVKDLPLSIGMAMDTSGSMQTRMDEAQKAGATFLQEVLRKGDKAFLLAFDEKPQMVQRWSTKLADMHAGLARLRAQESTALYDAVVEALYNFQGVRGQKALVLISDGKDTASKFSFEQTLEYARRAAVPVYAIGIGIRTNDIDVRHKLQKLCAETGGTVYHIDRAADLRRIYDDIQTELRSQYVLGFYPTATEKNSTKWREVEVKVSEGKARTVKGYYP